MSIDWEKKIQIDTDWVARQLICHFNEKQHKITIRGYTPKANGTSFSCDSLIEELGYMIVDYVHSEQAKEDVLNTLSLKVGEKQAIKRKDIALYQEAQAFFGKKDPSTDGKYGELLLFALCESVLKCKMVAHKITGLSNGKDQVKGGDGIFLGNYEVERDNIQPARFIGESKIQQGRSDAFDEAFSSLNRFHAPEVQAVVNKMEYIVAKNTISIDNSDTDFDEIYERLTPNTDSFRNQVLVHPILIMYNTAKIDAIEKKATTNQKIEELIKYFLEKEKVDLIDLINKKIKFYPSIGKVYVDFFIFPFNNIDLFRNGMYQNIHGVEYSK
ncbi:Hachiman antiphage defense system protein HamA [Dysgonomonas massiliensis]|uniref:Hachiman antiphage defense system protein HamA n=1 Tax=Dysgonomonas massiliensis TaxID=2040292 RepID=UPI000C794B18|nr:Hachiman antiphage defense system protein HamA [Dysgonomonas massiliensis]